MGSGGGSPEQGPTPQERELARHGAEDVNQHRRVFAPLEKRFVTEANTTEGEKRNVTGITSADSAILGSQAKRSLFRSPNAMQAVNDLQQTSLKAGAMRGKARSDALLGAENNEIQAKHKLVKFGRGLRDSSRLSLTSEARRATELQGNQLLLDEETRANRAEAIGQVAGSFAAEYRRTRKPKEPNSYYDSSGGTHSSYWEDE